MGSSRWPKKDTVEDCDQISIFWLRKQKILLGGYNFSSGSIEWRNRYGEVRASVGYECSTINGYFRLFYTRTNKFEAEEENMDYKVELTTTPCNFGGERYWFICPLVANGVSCNRRVGTLYQPWFGRYFGCRFCYDLSYKARQEHKNKIVAAFAAIDNYIEADRLYEKKAELRVKFWRGQPTKRYRKLLEKERRLDWKMFIASEMLMRKKELEEKSEDKPKREERGN